ncbi:MAG: hypothetical protein J1E60_02125 [Christensenellaceae bacterium]|nr:hypothetical protein [Christensenellaceae bacterium]
MKKLSIIIAILTLLCAVAPVSAHTKSQKNELDSCYRAVEDNNGPIHYGSEENTGWCIKENKHINGTSTNYKFHSSVSKSEKELFYSAVKKWSDRCRATMNEVTSGNTGIVYKGYPEDYVYTTGWNALTMGDADSQGHFTKWEIYIHPYTTVKETTLIHEIGHVFGLGDLYLESNKDRIMYNSDARTATVPTAYDISGFNVITGMHTTHDWRYTNTRRQCAICNGTKTEKHSYIWSNYSSSMHKGVCSLTGEVVYEPHKDYINLATGACKRCGRTQPSIVPSEFDEVPN